MIYNWYDKGKQRGWSRNWGSYCNEQKPEHLCCFFSFSTKELTHGYFFISPLVYLPLCSRGEIRM